MAITIESGFLDDDDNSKEIKQENVSDEKEYIKSIIKKGLEICNTKRDLIEDLLDNIEVFEPMGINSEVSMLLTQMKNVFETSAPALLLGDYSKLNINDEEYIDTYKILRKKLIKNIKGI